MQDGRQADGRLNLDSFQKNVNDLCLQGVKSKHLAFAQMLWPYAASHMQAQGK